MEVRRLLATQLFFMNVKLVRILRMNFISSKRGDLLRGLATAIVILIGVRLATACRAHADWDAALSGNGRTYALSGVMDLDIGYGFLLWGDQQAPWYGYVRPHVDANSAGTYNSLDGSVDFFPISFLGVRAGGEAIQNDSNYTAYDCADYVCRERTYRSYVQAELKLGAGPVFAQLRWRRERWNQAKPGATPFIEPTGGFALNGQGDAETVYRGLVGYRLDPNWDVLAALVYAAQDSTRGISRQPFAAVRYRVGTWSFGAGAGTFASPLKKCELTALGFFSWEIAPSVVLH